MGQALSERRRMQEEKEHEAKEKLAMLEKMAHAQLASKQHDILHGSDDDQEIHKGTVVSKHEQIYVDASTEPKAVNGAIKSFFSGDLVGGFMELLCGGVNELLGNNSVGENEIHDMYIIWENNSLLRCDAYYWKYNFSSRGVVDVAENVFAVYLVKRVINPLEVDPYVLIWAISRMCFNKGLDDEKSLEYVKHIMEKVKDVKQFIDWSKSYPMAGPPARKPISQSGPTMPSSMSKGSSWSPNAVVNDKAE